MNYYHLKSILSTAKTPITLRNASPSFSIAGEQSKVYIEPTFEKVFFETEKPTIILVSAVGATGKTALAKQLSRDTGLPLLDLGKHKPVGDNTLTGLLTHAFEVKDISNVLHLSNQATSRQEFVTKLANAGCNVDTTGSDWLAVGNFATA